jgi:APA family basic amino acid/polyamine antiporter
VTRRLFAVLGVTFGLAVIVGNTIGAGILRTPGEIAGHLPVAWMFFAAWIAGALYAFGGANAVSELATMLPHSGGQYNYARHALGPYAGFVVGWNDFLSTAGTATAVSMVLAESMAVLVPRLAGLEGAIASAVIVAFTIILWRGVREGAAVQTATSVMKAVAFLVLIGAGFVFVARHGVATPGAVTVPRGLTLAAAFIIAMQSVIYSYDGWTGAIYFTEEVRDPGRAIPRATFGGLIAVTIIYLLVTVAFVMVVPLSHLAGDKLAAGTVAQTIFGDTGDRVVRIIIVVSLLSSLSSNLLMAPRVLFAMSRDGLAPQRGTNVNAGGTPTTALFATAAVALAFLLTGTFNAVIAVLSFFFVATYSLSFLSVFVLRRREPHTPRPFRARGHPWTTGLMFAGSLAFLTGSIWSDPHNGLIAAALVVLSLPAYRFAQRFSPR